MGIMGTFYLLAELAHAEAEGHGGLGLNLNIFETNLINLALLIGVLVYFGRKSVSNILSERRSKIETAIKEAEQRQQEAAALLSDAQQKLTQAQSEAERIRKAADESARVAREAILAKAVQDVERLQETAAQDLNTERDRAIAELRQRVALMAMQQAESQLRSQLDDSTQQQLIDRSIALVGGGS
ncbi:MAG: F0F1 ATP synthase subunit B [Chamaesiphon sp.]